MKAGPSERPIRRASRGVSQGQTWRMARPRTRGRSGAARSGGRPAPAFCRRPAAAVWRESMVLMARWLLWCWGTVRRLAAGHPRDEPRPPPTGVEMERPARLVADAAAAEDALRHGEDVVARACAASGGPPFGDPRVDLGGEEVGGVGVDVAGALRAADLAVALLGAVRAVDDDRD